MCNTAYFHNWLVSREGCLDDSQFLRVRWFKKKMMSSFSHSSCFITVYVCWLKFICESVLFYYHWVSVLCRVCLVSTFGLFPVLVECDYYSVHLCFSLSMIILWIILSLISSGLLVTSVSLSCPAWFGYIKDYNFELHLRLRAPRSSLECAPWHWETIMFCY